MVESKIIDYLTLEILKNKEFELNPTRRIRSAFIEAKKQFKKMSQEDKDLIIKKIKSEI